jgi:hypothetical protein
MDAHRHSTGVGQTAFEFGVNSAEPDLVNLLRYSKRPDGSDIENRVALI